MIGTLDETQGRNRGMALAGAASGSTVAVGTASLAFAGLATPNPAEAATSDAPVLMGLVVGGFALGLLRDPARSGPSYGRRLALGVVAVGTVALVLFVLGSGNVGTSRPSLLGGSMTILLGAALLTLDSRHSRGPQPAQFVALLVCYVASLALLGHASNNPRLFSLGGVALPWTAAAAALLLGLGIMVSRPDRGFAAILGSKGGGGIVARRLLFVPVVVPMGMGLLLLVGQWAGFLSAGASAWLFSMAYFCGFTLVIWWVASRIVRLEVETERHQEQFRAVAESAAQAIVSVDERGSITYLNPAGERMFALRAPLARGRPFVFLFPERFRCDLRKSLEAELRKPSQSAERTFETVGLRVDGEEFPLEVSLSGWKAAGKTYVSGILSDVTERKFAEGRLLAANSQLAEANRELESFSYSVSHDLRAPLRAIHGFSRILDEDYSEALPVDARELLHDICINARRMGQLVDDLLEFSRLGKLPLKATRVSMDGLVRECLGALRRSDPERIVEIEIGSLPEVRGDPGLLKQVWTNLLSNAWKYTRAKDPSRIEIGSIDPGSPGGAVEFFVRDNGAGFDMQYADKLFGVFQRLHRDEDFEGTGVGLAIVQRIVHRHGGRIWADAAVGRGAQFNFTLGG